MQERIWLDDERHIGGSAVVLFEKPAYMDEHTAEYRITTSPSEDYARGVRDAAGVCSQTHNNFVLSQEKPSGAYALGYAKANILALLPADQPAPAPFQDRVEPWMIACFGEMVAGDREERNHRFLEEALELVQALGCPAEDARALVEYVYSRDVGDPPQEVGGVMVTLAALCLANELDMHECGETELARVWTKVEQIRAKQAAKPKGSALPQEWPGAPHQQRVLAERAALAEKCVKLEAFLGSPAFHELDVLERDLLSDQHDAMTGYLAILDRRIERFSPPPSALKGPLTLAEVKRIREEGLG